MIRDKKFVLEATCNLRQLTQEPECNVNILTFEADSQPFSLRVPNHRLYGTAYPGVTENILLNQ